MKKHALNLHTSSSAFIFHKGKEGWDSPAHMLNCIIIIDAGQVKKYAFASLSAILHTYGKRRGAVRGGGWGGSPAHMSCSTGWLVRGLPGSSLHG